MDRVSLLPTAKKLARRRLAMLAAGLAWPFLPSRAADPVRIIAIHSRTGTLATGLHQSKVFECARMAAEELNQQGGILNRQIEVIELDTQSGALRARAAAIEAANLRPLAVIGESKSNLALAMAPILQQAGVIMVTPNATHPDLTKVGDHIFRLSFVDAFQAQALAEFARQHLKAARAVVLTNVSSKYSEELSREFITLFRQQGGRVLLQAEYVQDSIDYTSMLARVKDLQPEVLFIPSYAKDGGALMRQARAKGIEAIFLGGDGWGLRVFEYGGQAVLGCYHTVHWHPDDPNPLSRDFVRRYGARFQDTPSDVDVLFYDAVHVMADAVRRAKSFDTARVREALAQTKSLERVSGTISFDAGRNARKEVTIVRQAGRREDFIVSIKP